MLQYRLGYEKAPTLRVLQEFDTCFIVGWFPAKINPYKSARVFDICSFYEQKGELLLNPFFDKILLS